MLLPKPNKVSRQPKDLRPIGVQDPASKLIARVLRDRLSPQVTQLLHASPQYAYTQGKSIDSAILRVVRHCREIRGRLQAGALSVHARAAGAQSSSCYGGVMMGIDLSRAFDNLTREVLQKSLVHAKVDESLQRVLLEIHCQCTYQLKHQTCTGNFAMQKGVRQGCSVSPMLYSLFTVWLMAELKDRVEPDWVERMMTCFADDTHLAWKVEGLEDLAFVCKTVRAVFVLLDDCGMVANADKSSIIMGIRGTSARKWIQSHQVVRNGQKFVNFGLPSEPLLVPSVKQFGYLGVQVSYGAFEMQTLLFRQQAASANRARLVRILHHRQLALRRRVSLYLSCVRSSLIFGLHATGLTAATLRKLDASHSRHLRAIAKSPSHITKKSTTALRLRLRVQSPEEAIVALLRRRIACCQEAASVEDLQSYLSALLSDAHTSEGVSPSPSIVPCNAKQPVACPVCGVYFDNMRHMLSHQARQHGCQLPKVPLPKSTDYTEHTVQGLPQCKHCLGIFTRVEALKKHLRRSCPVLHEGTTPPRETVEATGPGVLGASDREGSLGHSCRIPQAAAAESPLEHAS